MWELMKDKGFCMVVFAITLILGFCTLLQVEVLVLDEKIENLQTEEVRYIPYEEPTEETLDSLTQAILDYDLEYALETKHKALESDFLARVEEYTTEEEKALEVPRMIYTGFVITYYCPCKKCCGKWAQYHTTATGTTPTEGRTIAVDPNVIPYGSIVKINGHDYVAEDTGSSIKGNRIDIYLESHEEALQRGVESDVTIYVLEKGWIGNE